MVERSDIEDLLVTKHQNYLNLDDRRWREKKDVLQVTKMHAGLKKE